MQKLGIVCEEVVNGVCFLHLDIFWKAIAYLHVVGPCL